jgi:carboxyl-terminal processing protease
MLKNISEINSTSTVLRNDVDDIKNHLSGDYIESYSGIGAVLGMLHKGNLTINYLLKDSPAEKAGLKSGDRITRIDSVDVISGDLIFYQAVDLIRGPKGSDVCLTIVSGSEKPKEVTITRDIVKYP